MENAELFGIVVGVVTAILAILGAVVGITRYIVLLQAKVREERLQSTIDAVEKRYGDLDAHHRELTNDLAKARELGSAALLLKNDVDDILRAVMKTMYARSGSVYLPLPSEASAEPKGLVFISIEPSSKEAAALKRKIIPLKSLAGRCLQTGKPFLTLNPKSDPDHFSKADEVSGYHTEDILNVPLRYEGETFGVIQLLNKQSPEPFSQDDLKTLELEVRKKVLASKVAEFCSSPNNLEFLGVLPERESETATVMFLT